MWQKSFPRQLRHKRTWECLYGKNDYVDAGSDDDDDDGHIVQDVLEILELLVSPDPEDWLVPLDNKGSRELQVRKVDKVLRVSKVIQVYLVASVPLDVLDWMDSREVPDRLALSATLDLLALKAKSEILDVLARRVTLVSLFFLTSVLNVFFGVFEQLTFASNFLLRLLVLLIHLVIIVSDSHLFLRLPHGLPLSIHYHP